VRSSQWFDNAAQLHRPTDRDTLHVAAVELAQRGLTARDIATSLGLTETAVRQLLAREAA
jgi:orotate phosphoribosyltransferase-like protein